MTYYSLLFKEYNVISFPKTGCTQVIKYCTDLEQYVDHGHSYTSNTCLKNGTIHNCGNVLRSENETFKYLIPVRYPCVLYTSPSPRDLSTSRMPSSA